MNWNEAMFGTSRTTAFAEARRVESEVLVIMDEHQENQDQHDISNASFCSSFPGFTQMNLMIWDMV